MKTVLRSAFDLRKSLERKAGTKSAGDPQPLVARFRSEVDWWQNKSKTKQNKTKQNKTKQKQSKAKQSKANQKQNRSRHNKTTCETIKTTCKNIKLVAKKKNLQKTKKIERKNETKQNHHSLE